MSGSGQGTAGSKRNGMSILKSVMLSSAGMNEPATPGVFAGSACILSEIAIADSLAPLEPAGSDATVSLEARGTTSVRPVSNYQKSMPSLCIQSHCKAYCREFTPRPELLGACDSSSLFDKRRRSAAAFNSFSWSGMGGRRNWRQTLLHTWVRKNSPNPWRPISPF